MRVVSLRAVFIRPTVGFRADVVPICLPFPMVLYLVVDCCFCIDKYFEIDLFPLSLTYWTTLKCSYLVRLQRMSGACILSVELAVVVEFERCVGQKTQTSGTRQPTLSLMSCVSTYITYCSTSSTRGSPRLRHHARCESRTPLIFEWSKCLAS